MASFAADGSEFGSFVSPTTGSAGSAVDPHGGVVTIVNWWEMALLALGPLLAFLYALSAALFLPGWGECSLSDVFPSLMPRNSLLILAVAFAVHRSQHEPEEMGFRLLVAVCISAAASLYCMQQTRQHQIEGGSYAENPTVPRLDKKVMVVTGSNAGIGKETARQLYWSGATVILACRSVDRAKQARDDILATPPSNIDIETTDTATSEETTAFNKNVVGKIEIQSLDLGSLKSVRQAAKELLKKYKTIDCLINNAGIMMDQQSFTEDGYDLTMQANYLGHYLLTRLLLPALQKSKDARIVNVTSSTYTIAASNGGMDLDDLNCNQGKRKYTLFGQYAQSKLAQMLFTNELELRYGDKGHGIFTASVHPGLVRTDVVKNLPFWMKAGNASFSWILKSLQKTPEQGAWCSVMVATAPTDTKDEDGDGLPKAAYWVNRRTQDTRECATSVDDAKALWELSAKLVGLEN